MGRLEGINKKEGTSMYVVTIKGKALAGSRRARIISKLPSPVLSVSEIVIYVSRYPKGRTKTQIFRFFQKAKPPRDTRREWGEIILEQFHSTVRKGYLRKV